jgi:hypothetical protein
VLQNILSLTVLLQTQEIFTLHYTRKWEWKAVGDRLQRSRYLSRDENNQKIRARKQRPDISKYSFANRTIKPWNQLAAEALATSPVNHMFLERGLGK